MIGWIGSDFLTMGGSDLDLMVGRIGLDLPTIGWIGSDFTSLDSQVVPKSNSKSTTLFNTSYLFPLCFLRICFSNSTLLGNVLVQSGTLQGYSSCLTVL